MAAVRFGCRVLTVVMIWLAVGCAAAGAAEVIVKPNPKDPTAGDVYLKKSHTAKAVKLRTVSNVYLNHYHSAEYKNGSLYIIRRVGAVPGRGQSDSWTDELWRYTQSGRATKLFSAQGLDFRVRDDGGLIAVLAPVTRGTYKASLFLLARDGKVVRSWRPGKLASADLEFEEWAGQYLWLKDQETVEISGFVRIDSRSMNVPKYDVTQLALTDTDYDLNTSALRLAYSDYPPFFDVDSEREFEQAKTPVKLYVCDLRTKRRRVIARSTARDFNPKWIASTVVEYDNPRGKGRVRKTVGRI